MAENKSKFFGGSSSSSDSETESSDDEPAPAPVQQEGKQQKRWAEHSSSDDDEPIQRRVVKKQSDRRYDQLAEQIKTMRNHVKIDDYSSLITDYETILRTQAKLATTIGQQSLEGPPAPFIKALRDLELYIEREHASILERKERGERLTQAKNTAFNTLRQRVKKGNRPFQEAVDYAKQHPLEFESEQEEDAAADSSDSESEAAGRRASDSDSSDDDSDSGSDSDSDSDSSSGSGSSSSDSGSSGSSSEEKSWKSGSESEDEQLDEEAAREKKMLRWLITPEKQEKQRAKEEERENQKRSTDKKEKVPKNKLRNEGKNQGPGARKEEEQEELDLDVLLKKVGEFEMQQRGRKGFDRKAYLDKLADFMKHAIKIGPLPQLYILSTMVSADFDKGGSAFAAIKVEMWNEAIIKVNKMMPLVVESYALAKEAGEDFTERGEESEDPASYMRLQQLTVSFVERLDDELYKALQFTVDVYGSEYQEILANSSRFLVLLKKSLKFFEETKQVQPLASVSLRLMEHLYYKPDLLNAAVFEAMQHNEPECDKEDWEWPKDSHLFMAKLSRNVQASRQPLKKLRAALCQCYHLALHNRFQEARDLLHLGKIQDQVLEEGEIHTQILYNRVIAQMGLCAFRLGKIQDAHICLMDVCMHNKARELLAQGLSYSKSQDKTQEQEEKERLRQLPYHMHINLEVLESAHHICAMLLEVPNMAMQSIDPQKTKTFSRVLRRALELYDKQVFVGPPENPKEAVVSAAKALQKGDWQSAYEALEDLKLWDHIDPGNPTAGASVKEMIKEKIKVEALRTYLFAYASIYDAFHLDQLVGMFDLPAGQVHSVVSKMMIKEEITAFWDESSKFVLVQHTEPTHLQRLALQLAESVANAVDNNERLMDQKIGGHVKDSRTSQQQGRWDQPIDTKGGARRFGGKGGPQPVMDLKGGKSKGRGKTATSSGGAPRNRGWENARAAALRGPQRGFLTRAT